MAARLLSHGILGSSRIFAISAFFSRVVARPYPGEPSLCVIHVGVPAAIIHAMKSLSLHQAAVCR
jgi:hypothetical protein